MKFYFYNEVLLKHANYACKQNLKERKSMKMSKREAGIVAATIIAIFSISFAFASNEGVPFEQLWEAVTIIQTTVEVHQTDISGLENTISSQETRITELENQIALLESLLLSHTHDFTEITGNIQAVDLPDHQHDYSDILNTPPTPLSYSEVIDLIDLYSMGAPDYDSGWLGIEQGENMFLEPPFPLNTGDYLIYVLGRQLGWRVTHNHYGLDSIHVSWLDPPSIGRGLYWDASYNSMKLVRATHDEMWEEVRVLIWELPPPI
jgi:hypothetical protein